MKKQLNQDWLKFVYQRLNDLHSKVFDVTSPNLVDALTYFAYHKLLNDWGCGTDYSQHPRNPFYHP